MLGGPRLLGCRRHAIRGDALQGFLDSGGQRRFRRRPAKRPDLHARQAFGRKLGRFLIGRPGDDFRGAVPFSAGGADDGKPVHAWQGEVDNQQHRRAEPPHGLDRLHAVPRNENGHLVRLDGAERRGGARRVRVRDQDVRQFQLAGPVRRLALIVGGAHRYSTLAGIVSRQCGPGSPKSQLHYCFRWSDRGLNTLMWTGIQQDPIRPGVDWSRNRITWWRSRFRRPRPATRNFSTHSPRRQFVTTSMGFGDGTRPNSWRMSVALCEAGITRSSGQTVSGVVARQL